ncbi:MAG TPA: SDR family NAD(P)-dependent oxidoreductase, partial [Ktedonobacterales bacterium]|nr:SDR family NAD(P)-dependent oxidoreductase [Ktedonobacterales bacterium]
MELNLRGKTAIVTGASQGIGKEIARLLHTEGVHIVMVSQHAETLEKAARAITGASIQAGGRKPPAIHP